MGQCHSDHGEVIENQDESPHLFPPAFEQEISGGDDEPIVGRPKNTQELYSYIDKFQQQNYERLLKTFENDKELFILNQLLMSIQFFQNFDKSQILAKDFKRIKEHEVNNKLAKLAPEGVIGGDRRVVLMHGMGEILAQNFIYRPKRDVKGNGNFYDAFETIYRRKPKTETFTCEGILPLDFFLNYDNYEVYTRRQFLDLQENDYSSSPTDSPIFRLCMEEPDKENKPVPKGYVSLLLENASTRPISIRSRTPSGIYSIAGETAHSENRSVYTSSYYSEEEDTLSTINMQPGEKLLHKLEKKMNQPDPSPFLRVPNLSSRGEESSKSQDVINNLKFEGFLPKNYPSSDKRTAAPVSLAEINESENPVINVNGLPTTPNTPSRSPTKQATVFFSSDPVIKISPAERPGSLSLSNTRKPVPIPKDEVGMTSRNSVMSPTGSVTMLGRVPTLTGSANSDGYLYKQYQELQDLSLFPRHHKLVVGQTNPVIAPEYLIEEKVEKEDDNFGDEDESSSDSGSDTSSSDGSSSEESDDFVTRTYLNSIQFSSVAFSDFSLIGTKIGINSTVLQNAQVLGTTIRCSVNHQLPNDNDRDFTLLYTFTPSLHSKHWPPSTLMYFRQRLLRTNHIQRDDDAEDTPKVREELSWPSRIQVESIEGLGCGVIPEGFHTIKQRPQAPKEWKLNFPQGESLLLNTFKHVHWRAYIFTALLFRAFIFPMGPCGVGLEHIRNLMYQMCEEDYIFWNEEESGSQLRAILDRLYESLGNRRMTNFFIPAFDMFRTTPPQSTRRVQALLSNIRENLTIHFIFALRNLTCLQSKDKIYPIPDLKKLYRLITWPDTGVLYINNPQLLDICYPQPDTNNNSQNQKKNKRNKTKNKHKEPMLLDYDSLPNGVQKEDKFQSVLNTHNSELMDKERQNKLRRYERHLTVLAEKERLEKTRRSAMEDTTVIPVKERRKSIDLEKLHVTKYNNLRTVLIIEYFIIHFLKMASKALTFRSFSQATMYTLHVENLCKLLGGLKLQGTNMVESTITGYKRECQDLRNKLGLKMSDYVRSKLSHLDLPDGTSAMFLNPRATKSTAPPANNFLLTARQLPTPPRSASSQGGSMRKFENDGIALPSPTADVVFSRAHFEPDIHHEFDLPQDDNLKPHRRQSVQFDRNQPSVQFNRRNSLFDEPLMIGAADMY